MDENKARSFQWNIRRELANGQQMFVEKVCIKYNQPD